MLFEPTHKWKSLPTMFTHKFKFLVVILVLVKGGVGVKSFATIRTELYVMITAVMFI